MQPVLTNSTEFIPLRMCLRNPISQDVAINPIFHNSLTARDPQPIIHAVTGVNLVRRLSAPRGITVLPDVGPPTPTDPYL